MGQRGRPKGSKTKPRTEAVAIPSRCHACGSSERSEYYSANSMEFEGIDALGNPYNRITWRRTSCKACGAHRVDKTYEYILPKSEELNREPNFQDCNDEDDFENLGHGECSNDQNEDCGTGSDPANRDQNSYDGRRYDDVRSSVD